MRWDLVNADNPELAWVRRLIELCKQHRALRIGDYRPVTGTVLVKNADLMDAMPMTHLLAPAGAGPFANMSAGTLRVALPGRSFVILQPTVPDLGGYNRYKRVP